MAACFLILFVSGPLNVVPSKIEKIPCLQCEDFVEKKCLSLIFIFTTSWLEDKQLCTNALDAKSLQSKNSSKTLVFVIGVNERIATLVFRFFRTTLLVTIAHMLKLVVTPDMKRNRSIRQFIACHEKCGPRQNMGPSEDEERLPHGTCWG